MRYAIIDGGVVRNIAIADNPQSTNWIESDVASVGWGYVDGAFVEATPPTAPVNKRMTKTAFQARFPKSADGISSKFDLLMLFLTDGDYSAYLVPDAQTRFGLKALITAGKNKLDSSLSVDLGVTDAAMFTGLLTQASIPSAFQLTSEERAKIIALPVLDSESYKP